MTWSVLMVESSRHRMLVIEDTAGSLTDAMLASGEAAGMTGSFAVAVGQGLLCPAQ